MSSKKLSDGRSLTQEERKNEKKIGSAFTQKKHKIAAKALDNHTQKESKPMKETGGNFSRKKTTYIKTTGSGSIKSINARQLSFYILKRYFSEKSNLKSLLNESLKKYSLSELDRRFIYEVVKGTVRYFTRIDFLISLFSNKNVKSLDGDVLNIIRQAVYQMLYMDKTPAYAAVNESVEIAKKHIGIYSSRFVNAILRKINGLPGIQDFLDGAIKNTFTNPAERLSVMYSYPEWLADYWINSYGIDRTELLFKLLNREPAVFIRINRLKTDKTKLINAFKESGMLQDHDFFSEPLDNNENKGSVESFEKRGLFDDCIVLKSVQNIEKIPGYMQGYFSVQDFSSQFAVKYFLHPGKQEKILDICGAPGGKAAYMAELTDDNAEIVSVDISIKKIDLLEENIKRLGIKNISLVNADATETDFLRQDKFVNYFDKVFIDAPCSALGTISKNPDAKYAKTLSDMERLGEITGKILSAADKYLKPGGIMILYKCTLSEIENQGYVKKFLKQSSGNYSIEYPFSYCTYISASADLSDSQGFLQESRIAGSEDVNLRKDSIFQLASWLGPLLKNAPLFEIMPNYFSSEAGFICILKKSA